MSRRESQQRATNKNYHRGEAQHRQHGPQDVRQSIATQEQPPANPVKDKGDGERQWPSAKAWFDFLIVIFTAVLAVTSVLQWQAVRDTLEETRKMVGAAKVQADASAAQAKASLDQVAAAQSANAIQQEQTRPSFTGMTITAQPVLARIAVDLASNGHPASKLSGTADMTILNMPDNSSERPYHINFAQSGVLQANGNASFGFQLRGGFSDDPRTKAGWVVHKLTTQLVTIRVRVRSESSIGLINEQAFCRVLLTDQSPITGDVSFDTPTCEDAEAIVFTRRRKNLWPIENQRPQ